MIVVISVTVCEEFIVCALDSVVTICMRINDRMCCGSLACTLLNAVTLIARRMVWYKFHTGDRFHPSLDQGYRIQASGRYSPGKGGLKFKCSVVPFLGPRRMHS